MGQPLSQSMVLGRAEPRAAEAGMKGQQVARPSQSASACYSLSLSVPPTLPTYFKGPSGKVG